MTDITPPDGFLPDFARSGGQRDARITFGAAGRPAESDLFTQVDRYWQARRGARQAPLRTDIDPRAIAPALPFVLIAERLAPGIARLRIAGSELNDLLGMEARGMPMTVFAEPEARRILSAAIDAVCNEAAVMDMRLTGPASYGRPALSGRLMLWPLASDTGVIDRLLGCLVPLGETGRAPRRFQISLPRRVSGPPCAVIPGMAEPQVTFAAQPPAIRSRGHLRLIKSDL